MVVQVFTVEVLVVVNKHVKQYATLIFRTVVESCHFPEGWL